MKYCCIILWHALATLATRLKPGGARAVVAENILLKHQLMILTRSNKRSPKLKPSDRFILGFCAPFTYQNRMVKIAIILKSSTLLKYHKALVSRKYRKLFSSKTHRKPRPKGPSQDMINAVLEMKRRNSRFGVSKISQQINLVFGTNINKDIVRRILENITSPTEAITDHLD